MKASLKMEHSRLIRKHLPRLLGSTRCTDPLLHRVFFYSILTKEEISILEKLSPGYERNFEFWYFIRRKADWNPKLTEIFQELGQTGVSSILLQVEKEIFTGNEYGFIKDLDPLHVKVIRASQISIRADDYYNLDPQKIGLALIINVTDYDFEKNRTPSQQDATNISELFNQLGYKVTKCEGRPTKREIYGLFDSLFVQFTEMPFLQSCVVYIGSHGKQNQILASDGTEIDLSEIVLKFMNCGQLDGKPKIFIVQSSGICVPYIRDQLQDVKDTAIFVASQQNELLQSFSIYTFTEILMREARRLELKEMLHKVTMTVRRQLQLSVSDENVPTYFTFTMRPLYFNVKPYKT